MNTIFSFSKVSYIERYWQNQFGDKRYCAPRMSVHGTNIIGQDPALPHPDYPQETLYERALRLDLLDKWNLHIKVHLTFGRALEFTGTRAEAIWAEWCRLQFSEWKKGKNYVKRKE